MKKRAILVLVAGICLPAAQAQNYHQNYGDTRVVRQNQTGLYYSDPSYISPGCMSQSAKGNNSAGLNANLPSVSMGGTIRTPGDNLYNGSLGMRRNSNGSVVYSDYLQAQQMQRQMMQMQRQMQYQQRLQPQGNFYVPGSNGGVSSYGGGGGGVQYRNGVAGYK